MPDPISARTKTMSSNLYEFAVPVFDRYLGTLDGVLAKGAAHAAERKVDETVLTGWRLFPDMFPLTRQVQIAADFAKGASARLAGVDIPAFEDIEKTFAELQARVAKTRDFLKTLPRDAFEGSAERVIKLTAGGTERQFVGTVYLTQYALPNFFFHCATAYNLLRHVGTPLGKRDFVGGF